MRRPLLFALSLLGLFDSLYLFWVYTSPSHPLVCLGTGCDVVRASPYAHVMGYPMPVFGVVMYGAVALLLFAQPLLASWLARGIQFLILSILAVAFLASVYLTGLEAFVIHAWCAWCVGSAIIITLMLAAEIWKVVRPTPRPAFDVEPDVEMERRLEATRVQFALFLIWLAVGIPTFLLLARSGELPPLQAATQEALAARLVRPDSHITGNPEAPVTVVEFGDFECPICGTEEAVTRAIREKYGNQIQFVFRQFPLTRMHPQAEKAAEASECAAAQGKFWEMAPKLYASQIDLSVPALERYAGEIGLDQGRFNQCLATGSMAARVREDVDDGHALNIRYTPTFFVGAHVFEGAAPYAVLAGAIDEQLSTHGAPPAPSAGRSASGASPGAAGHGPPVAQGTAAPSARGAVETGSGAAAADSGTAAVGAFGSDAGNIFAPAAGLACSEEDAKKQQPTLIHTPEAHQGFDSHALFLDVRPAEEFAQEHIPGALNRPVDQLDQRWSSLPADRTLIIYESGRGSGDICAAGRAAGRILLEHGFHPDRVKVYQEGLADWEKAGLPLEH